MAKQYSTRYAQGTSVTTSASSDEIERTLQRYACAQRAWLRDDERHTVQLVFQRKGQPYRLTMPLTDAGRPVSEAETRRRFRVLLIWLKATCEAVDTGLTSFEEAFLPHAVLPGGQTVAQAMQPQMKAALTDGRMPRLTFALPEPQP